MRFDLHSILWAGGGFAYRGSANHRNRKRATNSTTVTRIGSSTPVAFAAGDANARIQRWREGLIFGGKLGPGFQSPRFARSSARWRPSSEMSPTRQTEEGEWVGDIPVFAPFRLHDTADRDLQVMLQRAKRRDL